MSLLTIIIRMTTMLMILRMISMTNAVTLIMITDANPFIAARVLWTSSNALVVSVVAAHTKYQQ